jgi:hypothetical protein
MQSVSFYGCSGLTGPAELEMSDGHIYLIRFGGQPQHVLRSSFTFSFHSSFLAGDIGQMKLPVGMQSVNFSYCRGLEGKAES